MQSVFPRLKERGPIEANVMRLVHDQGLRRFPRLKERGPIEANTQHEQKRGNHRFHA